MCISIYIDVGLAAAKLSLTLMGID